MISFLIFYALLLCLVPQEHFVCFETIYYSTLDIGSSVMDSIKYSLMVFLGQGYEYKSWTIFCVLFDSQNTQYHYVWCIKCT